mgnify:CR=1 FL=1
MNLEEAQVFVEMTSQPLTEFNRQARCVDGRYENIQNFPMIAKPGGDVGDVMAAFAALNLLQKSLPNEIVLNAVVSIAGGPQKFSFHTDDHAEPNQPGLGCGHLKQAVTDPEAFGLTNGQTDFLVAQLPNLLEQGAHQEVLHGNHAEQATIVVDSETHGIMPLIRVGDNVRSAFVYQKTLHTQQLDALGKILQEELAKQGEVIEDHEIRKALDDAFGKQLTEILKRLASNLPVYTAMIDSEGSISIASF